MNTNRHQTTRKFLNNQEDYTDEWKAKYCQIPNNGDDSECKKKFEKRLKQSALAKKFIKLTSFEGKVTLFKENNKELEEFITSYKTIYYEDENGKYGIELLPETKEEVALYNDFKIYQFKKVILNNRLGFERQYNFKLKTLDELKSNFEKSIANSQLKDKTKLKSIEIQRINQIFKGVDLQLEQSKPINHWGKRIKLPTFQKIYNNKVLGIVEKSPFTREIEFSDSPYFDLKLGFSAYVEYLIYLENFDFEVYGENTKLRALMDALIENEFISEETNYLDFQAVFLENSLPKNRIKWIDLGTNKSPNKHTLFRLLTKVHPKFKVVENNKKLKMSPKLQVTCKIFNDSFKIEGTETFKSNTLSKSISTWLAKYKHPIGKEKQLIDILNNFIPSQK